MRCATPTRITITTQDPELIAKMLRVWSEQTHDVNYMDRMWLLEQYRSSTKRNFLGDMVTSATIDLVEVIHVSVPVPAIEKGR